MEETYLRREIEPQIAVVGELVLNQQRHLITQAQLHLVREAASLAEVDEVLEGEREGDGLAELDVDVLRLVLDVGVRAQRDGAVADVAAACKLDAVLGGLDGDCVPLEDVLLVFVWAGATHPTPTAQTNPYKSSETPPTASTRSPHTPCPESPNAPDQCPST